MLLHFTGLTFALFSDKIIWLNTRYFSNFSEVPLVQRIEPRAIYIVIKMRGKQEQLPPNSPDVPVVQRIEQEPSKLWMEVRFLPGTPNELGGQVDLTWT